MAKTYRTRPSELIGVSGNPEFLGFEAFWVDRAVMHFGQAVEADLENSIRTKGKNRKPMSEAMRNQKVAEVMAKWMGVPATERKFKDPAMKLREW